MASKTSKDYHATEEISFPEVSPEVKNKPTVDEQVVEMREWFKAWKSQDHGVRDHRKYFKPVLCYLEGAWTTATKDIDEPFESDRHFIDFNSIPETMTFRMRDSLPISPYLINSWVRFLEKITTKAT